MTRKGRVFHAGERAVQGRAGVSDAWREKAAGLIQSEMSDRHRSFFDALPLLFVGLLDLEGRPWAIPLFGAPGVAKARSPRVLVLSRAPGLAEILGLDVTVGASVGLLGIDLATRQRVRVNGRIGARDPGGLAVAVDQAFGNCPQYIQARNFDAPHGSRTPRAERTDMDSKAIRRIIARADTFFVASRGPRLPGGEGAGIDVSHRGGRPGFLGMSADGSLSFPDFRGNRFFNTLGNIEADGRVGLFVPDFATGAGALLTGRATIAWTSDRIGAFDGAERIVDVTCDEVWHVADALPATARLVEFWPALDRTGTW